MLALPGKTGIMTPMKHYVKTYLLFAAVLFAVRPVTPFLGVVDDAWITYTYARNLAAGHGIAFNPGEHVEGCTAFLHMVLLAPFAKLTARLDLVALVFNVLAWAGVATLTWGFLRRRDGGRTGGMALLSMAVVLLGLSGLAWTYSGMEMPLVALAWLGAAKLHLRERERGSWPWASALATVAAGLLRPDGILVAVPLALSTWYVDRKKFAWAKTVVYSVLVIGLFGGYWLWRWRYFGYLLPNTFYAKVTTTSLALTWTGVVYLLRWMIGMIVPGAALAAIVYTHRHRPPTPRWVAVMGGLVLTSMGYCLLVGADFFSYHRFLLPALAPVTLLFWWFGVAANAWRRKRQGLEAPARPNVALVVVLFVVMQLVYFVGRIPPQGLVHSFIVENTVDWGRVAADLNRRLPREATIATIPIGAMGYFSHRYILDMVGLTDTHIAHTNAPTGEAITGHEKFDVDYVLARRPELIYSWPGVMPAGPVGLQKWVSSNIGAEAQKQLMTDSRTQIQYRLCWLPFGPNQGVIGLMRQDLFGQPGWQDFQPLPPRDEAWIWYAFTSKNLQELYVKIMELRRGQFKFEAEITPDLDQRYTLPVGPKK